MDVLHRVSKDSVIKHGKVILTLLETLGLWYTIDYCRDEFLILGNKDRDNSSINKLIEDIEKEQKQHTIIIPPSKNLTISHNEQLSDKETEDVIIKKMKKLEKHDN